MLHPILDLSSFNVVIAVLSLFVLVFGFISLQAKQRWYLGEALPAFLVGIAFGPVGANFLNIAKWGGDDDDTGSEIAYDLVRLVIGIQLVKVGYQLPKRYIKQRVVEMTICLLPLMAIQWLITSACIKLLIPRISFLAALITGSCVTCTDPILSQAIAKGPFADNYVRRPLREFISAEAGANDGFAFPLLLLAVAILRYAETPENTKSLADYDRARNVPDFIGTPDVGRLGGGVGRALKHWVVEGVLYMIVLGAAYGATVGFTCRKLLGVALRRRWIDNESFTLMPLAIGLFVVGTCCSFGSDETLACFVAGSVLNWDGVYHAEIQMRHDTFNSSIETLLNFGAFMYLGAIVPWGLFHTPELNGITIARLFGLAFLVLGVRRIPAILMGYRFMPNVCGTWREALFMGYFGPIGIGAIAYVEYTRRLFPDVGTSDAEIDELMLAIVPVVYWLVFFSIVVHGLSVPLLNGLYRAFNVPRVCDHPVEVLLLSEHEPAPNNSTVDRQRHSVIVNNRFSRSPESESEDGADAQRAEDDRVEILRPSGESSAVDRTVTLVSVTAKNDRAVDTRDLV
ncbi:Sodium/hydrogen exchanger family-domain-containing protein [Aspergillus ambiguus]|uniref:putative plasma membrane antiporter n=1 Tax=Aspergillus ambiguus TaxID=176160 RepID=UPI003CCD259C